MGKVLETNPREQAGGDSYNRFEYQVHSIVSKIVGLIDGDGKEIIFCEYHDDFTQLDSEDLELYDFYQVKTKEDYKEWTLAELTKREKNKNAGSYKRTFLGRIFENFLNFGRECRRCYFISNAEFEKDIRKWCAYVQAGRDIKKSDLELYNRIHDRIVVEFGNNPPNEFEDTFEQFVNKTIIIKADLSLDNYEEKVKLAFIEKYEPTSIPINALTAVYNSIITEVRRKSKTKIVTPISKNALVEKKGIRIKQVKDSINKHLPIPQDNSEFLHFLLQNGVESNKAFALMEEKRDMEVRMTNTDNIAFIHAMLLISEHIKNYSGRRSIEEIKEECRDMLQNSDYSYVLITDEMIEVQIYERIRKNRIHTV